MLSEWQDALWGATCVLTPRNLLKSDAEVGPGLSKSGAGEDLPVQRTGALVRITGEVPFQATMYDLE